MEGNGTLPAECGDLLNRLHASGRVFAPAAPVAPRVVTAERVNAWAERLDDGWTDDGARAFLRAVLAEAGVTVAGGEQP